jgi:hypothetical protein
MHCPDAAADAGRADTQSATPRRRWWAAERDGLQAISRRRAIADAAASQLTALGNDTIARRRERRVGRLESSQAEMVRAQATAVRTAGQAELAELTPRQATTAGCCARRAAAFAGLPHPVSWPYLPISPRRAKRR